MKKRKVKCIIWDLDNTIWEGVLLEDENVKLREGITELIKELDNRGILQSVASKNDHETAMNELKRFGVDEYFIYPQINWHAKSASIRRIAELLNVGRDALAFIDDQPFEREEVSFSLPEVLCIDSRDISGILEMPEMVPRFITEDSRLRRKMYMNDIIRNEAEQSFEGTQEEFLAQLNMCFTIAPVEEGDLQRAEELTVRTNQLNATGYTYSYKELNAFRRSEKHKLFIAGLEDKYGAYGKIGLMLVECEKDLWTIKLLLMSCRVMSRGVGTIMLNYIMRLAKEENVRLQAAFIHTGRNRLMYITYKLAGFKEIDGDGKQILLENGLEHIQPVPDYVKLTVGGALADIA